MSSSVSVVILAAGLGTRMKSRKAKVLHRAGGATLLEHVIEAALGVAPASRITAVVGYQAEQVQAAVSHYGIRFQVQSEQKGTGHALATCAQFPGHESGRIVVLYGDCPLLSRSTIERLIAKHAESRCAATVITTLLDDPTGYGRVVHDLDGYVAAIVEEKAASEEQRSIREINSGIYCFEASLLWPHLARLKPNPASGEVYLTDIVEELRGAGHFTAPLLCDNPGEVLGINNRVELAEADRIFRDRKARELMVSGVTIEKPETVTIDRRVTVGADTVIGPFVQLLGRTEIGEGCSIGACSILSDAVLEDGAEVLQFTSIDQARLAKSVRVGPYARLRPGTVVEKGALIGNFVELKKTKLGPGAKAMHLAYLGDATIGADVNVGAGTITCNFDGHAKHETVIGNGAFIGSNSTLVAPVEIEAGSYVGAGSVITKHVPADSLAIARSHQVVKEGWAKHRREKYAKDDAGNQT
jgi:bifunctional UDP-N-acetylglucosamine pyrophosphorylase/glucosamine-1-phosphate N-acetyltransferase